jgi:hypothetical protein
LTGRQRAGPVVFVNEPTGLARQGTDAWSAESVAPFLWRLFVSDPDADWPPEFERLAFAADYVEDLPDVPSSLPAFMDAARRFLDSRG